MADKIDSKMPNIQSVVPLSIDKELRSSFLDYAMSVIVSRALPDVRDGLKPVHRRILYSMHTMGLYHERAYRKSATVVGDVMGHYHPHGDSAIYQSMVGMAQLFSKRYPLLDGQGNWGSVDGDNAAAMRYTEVRMASIARELLTDIEKNTVLFVPNFDESKTEPDLLPSKIPNLLINGTNGIAVGMATSIPPHNAGEVIAACLALLKDPELSEEELFDLVPGPDFPTGGIICGRSGILKAYRTGHGNVVVRGVVEIEETSNKSVLIITEIPFQVNKSDLINKIADLVKNKVIEGITNLRDESSNRGGMRVVIDIRRGDIPQVILNQLYKHTQLQSSISIIMLALLKNRPMIFTLREVLEQFLEHRREIIRRRSEFDLDKSKKREHVLLGLLTALENIDKVVELIKKASDATDAIFVLGNAFGLSEVQSKAILEMRLQRLTGLEQDKIREEMTELKKVITFLETILNDPEVLKEEIRKELEQIHKTYSDPRRSRIEASVDGIMDIDLIPDEDVVVTLTQKGYIKRVPLEVYEVQHRGGKGKKGMADLSSNDDIMLDLFVARNHDDLLFFTNKGRVYTLNVYNVPEGSRTAKGRAVINLLPLTEGETVVKLLCTRDLQTGYLVMVTKKGTIKKTETKAFAKVRSTGIQALNLNEGDELSFCSLSSGTDDIVLISNMGQGIRFNEEEVRPMGRHAAGVRGIRMREKAFVVGLEVISDDRDLLFATSRGYGKRVRIEDFRVAHRGGLGVRTIPVGARNGEVIGMARVAVESSVLLIDEMGKIIRLSPEEIRTMRRGAQGVRLIRLDESQRVSTIVAFDEHEEEDKNGNSAPRPLVREPRPETELPEDLLEEESDEELLKGDLEALEGDFEAEEEAEDAEDSMDDEEDEDNE